MTNATILPQQGPAGPARRSQPGNRPRAEPSSAGRRAAGVVPRQRRRRRRLLEGGIGSDHPDVVRQQDRQRREQRRRPLAPAGRRASAGQQSPREQQRGRYGTSRTAPSPPRRTPSDRAPRPRLRSGAAWIASTSTAMADDAHERQRDRAGPDRHGAVLHQAAPEQRDAQAVQGQGGEQDPDGARAPPWPGTGPAPATAERSTGER